MELIKSRIAGAAYTIAQMAQSADTIAAIGQMVLTQLKAGGKLLTCGNGGSAAEALHLSEELVGKYARPRRALPSICLCADTTALTCIANDWSFAHIFSRQVEAYAKPEDVLVIFSSSGKSANLLAAAEAMHKAGGKVIGLLGKGGGPLLPLCDLALNVVGDDTGHIQEAHQVVLHILLELVEKDPAFAA